MKLLVDMPLSPRIGAALRAVGYDAIHLSDVGLHRLSDAEVMLKAAGEGRVVLTADSDFGMILALLIACRPSVVTFSDKAAKRLAHTPDRLIEVLVANEVALREGAIVRVEVGRFRVRRLPIGT